MKEDLIKLTSREKKTIPELQLKHASQPLKAEKMRHQPCYFDREKNRWKSEETETRNVKYA